MGASESVTRGRELILEKPMTAALVFIGVVLLLDMLRQLVTGDLAISGVIGLVKDGLMRGLVIGLAGIGLSMTYSILNFANFAHGDYITAGAFSGWSVTYLIAGGFGAEANIGSLALVGAGGSVFGGALGINVVDTPIAVLVGLLVAGGLTIGLALFIDRFMFKPIRDAGGIPLLITSIGVAFALRYLILFVFDSSTRGTTAAGSVPGIRPLVLDGTVPLTLHDGFLVLVAGGLMLGVHVLLQRTKLGKAMRAMSDDESLARITGIPTERVVRSTWIIGGGLTGIAGYMFVLWKGTLSWNDGWLLLLLIFAAVILGGIGSVYGAILGGLVIGLTASTAVIWIPSGFARAAAFVVMILVLVVRPQGLFSGRSTA
ncbi:branched-chain amino acid ABC transporter permease [Halorubellus sp. JP-L1]|uniref:branched-chain amino acid ABC transporter permease n=1 Tax=Halorubellus sp. JP-L1 TaxID=2715753 RepID=UPI001408B3A3|nr:branched-chain amino acid ABC transporter permease [Halorubellus sp. JP-L1]NHN40559.1 branched-chain amino acid ABC transporter permease [Halorubellus sp. JP-L1]